MEEENKISSEGTTQLPSESQESESITEKDLHEPTQESTPNPEPTSVTSTVDVPKKNIFKFFKTIPGIITIAAVVACIVLAIVFINKHSKEKPTRKFSKSSSLNRGKLRWRLLIFAKIFVLYGMITFLRTKNTLTVPQEPLLKSGVQVIPIVQALVKL